MKYCLVFLMLLSAAMVQAGEDYKFKWLENDKEVGTLHISSMFENGLTKLNYDSKITVDVGEKVEVHDVFKNTITNDSLIYIGVARYFNSKPRITIIEELKNGTASKTINKEEKPFNRNIVVFTYAMLFTKPPVNVQSVYYEIHGEMYNIQPKGENSYVLTGPNGRIEQFNYDAKGELISAKIETNFGFYTLVQDK
jgi:hypothetical protein